MVCEKECRNIISLKDSIKCIFRGIYFLRNRTTLGADDGIGVAIAMAILCEKDLKHPEINIFTTAEERHGWSPCCFAKNGLIQIES